MKKIIYWKFRFLKKYKFIEEIEYSEDDNDPDAE